MSAQDECFVTDRISPDGKWACVFEDDGETGYLYLCAMSADGNMLGITDSLWIYNKIFPPIQKCKDVGIAWSDDSSRAALIVDGEGWGMIDLSSERKLTAPREDNCIVSIPFSIWEEGIPADLGEPLCLEVRHH